MTSIIGKTSVYSLQFTVYRFKKAFTLMEMLVVLAVIALLMGVSIPFFASFTKGAKLKTAAQDILSILNTARSFAITYRKNYSVVFDISSSPPAYYITDAEGKVYGKRYTLPASIKFYRPNNPNQPTTFPASRATFSSTGGLTAAAGSVWIADKKAEFRRISVSNTTGRVKIDREP